MAKTLHDRYVEALIARGSVLTPQQPSKKYTRLSRLVNGINSHNCYYFVGRSGAVRYGSAVTGSFAASDVWKKALLAPAKL